MRQENIIEGGHQEFRGRMRPEVARRKLQQAEKRKQSLITTKEKIEKNWPI